MKWDLIAENKEDFIKSLNSFVRAKTEKEAYERLQMTRLLKALAETPHLDYPARVRHTGNNSIPDFQLELNKQRIAVEVTRITTEPLERGRAIQHKELNKTLCTTNLIMESSAGRPSRTEVIQKGFGIPQLVLGPTVDQLNDRWIEILEERLFAKTKRQSSEKFVNGNEDWLLLWDKTEIINLRLEENLHTVSQIIQNFRSDGWFSRVFLQSEDFEGQAMFTDQTFEILPSKM